VSKTHSGCYEISVELLFYTKKPVMFLYILYTICSHFLFPCISSSSSWIIQRSVPTSCIQSASRHPQAVSELSVILPTIFVCINPICSSHFQDCAVHLLTARSINLHLFLKRRKNHFV